jgi:hypothetical protein
MCALFSPAWEDSLCIYCNAPVGSDGETDDGEFYSCAVCRESIERERDRVMRIYGTRLSLDQYDVSSGHDSGNLVAAQYY